MHNIWLLLVVDMYLLVYLLATRHAGHYPEKPLRYSPLIPHLKNLFYKFCKIRNNQTLSRQEADAQIDNMIMTSGSMQLMWAYDAYKNEKRQRNNMFAKRRSKWLKTHSDEARQLDAEIQAVRSNTNISYAEECRQVNKIKISAPECIQLEMRMKTEDCKEFSHLKPHFAKGCCYSEWGSHPEYNGALSKKSIDSVDKVI